MKRITLLKSHLDAIGGLEKITSLLAARFARLGCPVTLLTTGKILHSLPGVEIVSLGPTRTLTFAHLLAFDAACNKWLKQHPSDVVFGLERNSLQTHYRAGNGVHAAFLKQRALIDSKFKQWSFGWNPLHRTLLSLEKKCFEAPDLKTLFTNSEMVKKEILRHYKTPPEKIAVVPNGAPFHAWQEAFYQTFDRKREGPFRFLFLGNGFRRKGLHLLLQALCELKEEFHLDIVGSDKESPSFVRMAAKCKLSSKVTFWGKQREIHSFYQKADALVIPSLYDPFANVTMEGLAMGLYVVSSRFNGGSEVLTEENGTLIEELLEPASVALSLIKAMNHPKTHFQAENIRNSISSFDLSSQLDKIVHKTMDF